MNDDGTLKDWQQILEEDEEYQLWLDRLEAESERARQSQDTRENLSNGSLPSK